jgi:uncharacterized coiled-coil protein SlyX
VASLDTKVASLDNKVASLDNTVASLDNKVASVDTKVASLDTKVASLDNKVASLDTKVTVEAAKAANSRASAYDELAKVPYPNGTMPNDDDWPKTLAVLSVAGSELLPGKLVKGSWSGKKSLKLLRAYGNYETDDEGGTEEKQAQSSLRRRRELAKRIGVSSRQLSDAATLTFAM